MMPVSLLRTKFNLSEEGSVGGDHNIGWFVVDEVRGRKCSVPDGDDVLLDSNVSALSFVCRLQDQQNSSNLVRVHLCRSLGQDEV